MNTFYFMDSTEVFVTTKPATMHTTINTEKSFDDFIKCYDDLRENGNSIIDSIEWAR